MQRADRKGRDGARDATDVVSETLSGGADRGRIDLGGDRAKAAEVAGREESHERSEQQERERRMLSKRRERSGRPRRRDRSHSPPAADGVADETECHVTEPHADLHGDDEAGHRGGAEADAA